MPRLHHFMNSVLRMSSLRISTCRCTREEYEFRFSLLQLLYNFFVFQVCLVVNVASKWGDFDIFWDVVSTNLLDFRQDKQPLQTAGWNRWEIQEWGCVWNAFLGSPCFLFDVCCTRTFNSCIPLQPVSWSRTWECWGSLLSDRETVQGKAWCIWQGLILAELLCG